MKILIIKPSAMGDVIHGMPLINDIRAIYPEAQIAWLVNDTFVPLLEMVKGIDKIIPFSRTSLKKGFSLVRLFKEISRVLNEIRSFKPDIAIDIQCLLRSALFARFSGAKKRIGLSTGREGSTFFYSDLVNIKDLNMHALDKNRLTVATLTDKTLPLTPQFPIEIPEIAFQKIHSLLPIHFCKNKFIVLAPESNWVSKSWPEKHFIRLAQLISEKTSFNVVVAGINKPSQDWQKTADENPERIILLQGSTNLKELAALFQLAEYSVTNDSGPMHLSVAVNTSSFVIIGPTNADRTGPYRDSTVIKTEIHCSPCYKKICPLTSAAGKCMEDISPEQVISQILRELNDE